MQKFKRVLSSLVLCVGFIQVHGQDTLSYTAPHYDFLRPEENEIVNASTLSTVFESLYQLRQGNAQQVNLVQIGDSHIQADFFSGIIRQHLQRDFGNAGRGLVVPWRVAQTNEPNNIYSSSDTPWQAKRCVFPDQPLPIGIGGITIQTQKAGAKLTLKTLNQPLTDNRFNAITVFYQKEPASFNLAVQDSTNQAVAFLGPYTTELYANCSRVKLPNLTNNLTLETLKSREEPQSFTLFGINLENGKPGVLYHAIGVNGAKYKHYNVARYFAEQTPLLKPGLFIISLGTNESLDYPYADPQLVPAIDQLITGLKNKNPNAAFLLTTPPDHYRKKTRRNPGVIQVRNVIIQYAQDHNLAYWDLYQAGGGLHSADHYRTNNLLQRDGVHFTKDGYALQGNLFYAAFIKAYNTYVSYRHP